MVVYRRVYDSRHLQADCQEPGSAPEPYARQSSTGYLYLFMVHRHARDRRGMYAEITSAISCLQLILCHFTPFESRKV